MKKIINPDLFILEESRTNFLKEIDNGEKQTLKQYFKSFSNERLKIERKIHNTCVFFNIVLTIFIASTITLVIIAFNN